MEKVRNICETLGQDLRAPDVTLSSSLVIAGSSRPPISAREKGMHWASCHTRTVLSALPVKSPSVGDRAVHAGEGAAVTL